MSTILTKTYPLTEVQHTLLFHHNIVCIYVPFLLPVSQFLYKLQPFLLSAAHHSSSDFLEHCHYQVALEKPHLLSVDAYHTLNRVGNTQCFHDSSVVSFVQGRDVLFPVELLLVCHSPQHAQKCFIKHFDHSVSHGMVRVCYGPLDRCYLTELLDDLALKVSRLITV